MSNYNNETLLEMVELYATDNGLIDDEDALSDAFDSMVQEVLEQPEHGIDTDDEVAMNEWFSNWSDSLCKDGVIHPAQCDAYCYVGEYS